MLMSGQHTASVGNNSSRSVLMGPDLARLTDQHGDSWRVGTFVDLEMQSKLPEDGPVVGWHQTDRSLLRQDFRS